MTYRVLYNMARSAFSAEGLDSPSQDASALVFAFFGFDRPRLALNGDESPPAEKERAFLEAVAQRAARRPLQYILGNWEFMGLSLAVGEGVLVPREDTAVLVESLYARLKSTTAPMGVDLCSGTGAVALGLASLLPESCITCIELSPKALPYLEENINAYPDFHLKIEKGDILLRETAVPFSPQSLDFIASNPPYIPSGELSGLQAEVQREPALALDGGEDGLAFYRAIVMLWLPLLKPGGVLAVEIGETQGEQVSRLFADHGLISLEVQKDWAGLDRCVIGNLPIQSKPLVT